MSHKINVRTYSVSPQLEPHWLINHCRIQLFLTAHSAAASVIWNNWKCLCCIGLLKIRITSTQLLEVLLSCCIMTVGYTRWAQHCLQCMYYELNVVKTSALTRQVSLVVDPDKKQKIGCDQLVIGVVCFWGLMSLISLSYMSKPNCAFLPSKKFASNVETRNF